MSIARGCVVLLAATLLPVQLVAVVASWEVFGEVPQALAGLILSSNLVLVPLALWRPILASTLLVPWFLLVPPVGYFGYQHWRAQTEASQIVTWAFEAYAREGSFPSDLSRYTLKDPGIRSGIFRYEVLEGGRLHLAYGSPGQEGSAHWFDSETGWGYYPD